jgi:hypothetical protein
LANEHRLYLYGGDTFIPLPEAAWLNLMKSEPAGRSVRKSVENTFLLKGWVKLNEEHDLDNSNGSTIEWLFEETGAKVKTVVDADGQLKVNGKPIGLSTVAETYKTLSKMAEDCRLKKEWVDPAPEAKEAKLKQQKPEMKGGPSPLADVLTSQAVIANTQLIGKYEPLVAKENLTPPERMQKVNRLIEMAEKEENEQEQQRLLQVVDNEIDLLENSLGSKVFQMDQAGLKNIDSIKIDVIPGQVVGIKTRNESNGQQTPAAGR